MTNPETAFLLVFPLVAVLSIAFCASGAAQAAPVDDARRGVTLHVSKLGDNSDGLSWATAFTTVQAAL
ncbi:MAG TPA: hypothetical protein ENN65_06130, partial [Candidatus Hydrogenedentes bacterium]|nr:hypothetical protein [Candidatus Hydrogenedentota bacterium]